MSEWKPDRIDFQFSVPTGGKPAAASCEPGKHWFPQHKVARGLCIKCHRKRCLPCGGAGCSECDGRGVD